MGDRPVDTMSRHQPSNRAILAVVAFGVFVAADDLTVVSTMLRPIISDLGIVLPDGLDDAAWIVNAYLIAFVAVMPFMGRLSDVIGRRRVYIAAFSLFLVGSLIIPMADSFGPFLFGRVLTALGGGAMVPIGMAVVADVYPPGERARALGVLGGIETLGWVWGPLYGAMLVNFLSWHWQFYLNIPLAIFGIATAWWALQAFDRPTSAAKLDWLGAGALTITLVSLNMALLGSAEIQSVTGLEELTGESSLDLRWLYGVAILAGVWFYRTQRNSTDPLIDFSLFRGRNLTAAVVVNFLVGAALIIAMVDVPLFVNVVEFDVERAAVISGWVLSALTAAMAISSYLGGRMTERTWYRPPVVAGLAGALVAYLLLGFVWDADTAYTTMAWQLGLLGFGLGLVTAPTSAAVVDAAPPDRRGTAASLVMVLRLMGLAVGLSGLTAYGLWRFNALRGTLELPPLGDPGYQAALTRGQAELTTSALAETFLAAAALTAVALGVAFLIRRAEVNGTHGSVDATAPMAATLASSDFDRSDHRGDPMTTSDSFSGALAKRPAAVLGILAALTVLAVVAALFAMNRASAATAELAAVEAELEATRADMEQLRGGVALFSAQATLLQGQLAELAPQVTAGLDEAVAGLTEFEESTIVFDVPINEVVPISTEVVLDRTLQVPINTVLPINETIETTITVAGPFGIDVPLDITVPLDLDLPIDLDVAIPVNETIPIETSIPVDLQVPISVDVAGTELAELAASLRQGLISLRDVLSSLG